MQPSITPQMTVAELFANWPEAVPVFMKHRMSCIGCCMSSFETLQDAAGVYHLDLPGFLDEITSAVNQAGTANAGPDSE